MTKFLWISTFKVIMELVNPSKKGTLGEIAVCKELMRLGYSVFSELGNSSKVDLIVLDENYKTYKVQVKTVNSKGSFIASKSTFTFAPQLSKLVSNLFGSKKAFRCP